MQGRQREEMETESDEIPGFTFPRRRRRTQVAAAAQEEEEEEEGVRRNSSSLETLRWEGMRC